MKKQKGFTVVELLVVSVLTAVLTTLAIVSVNKVLEKSHNEYAKKQVDLITLAAQNYFSDHKSKRPEIPLTTNTVQLRTLINESYIDSVVDYKKKNYDYDKTITTVKKMGSEKYIYYTKLIDENGNVVIDENPDKKNSSQYTTIKISNYDTSETFRKNKIDNKYYVNGIIKFNVQISNSSGLSAFKYLIKRKGKNSSYFEKWYESEYKVIDSTNYSEEMNLSTNNTIDGTYKVSIIAYDYEGKSKESTSETIVIDKTKPECNLKIVDKNYSSLTPTKNGWFNEKKASKGINIEPSVNEDNNVCLYKMYKNDSVYRMDSFPIYKNADLNDGNFNQCGGHSSPNKLLFLIPSTNYSSSNDGDLYSFKVQDYAGNLSTCSKNIKIDTKPPTCNIGVTGGNPKKHSVTEEIWYTETPTIKLSYSDMGSGVDDTKVKLNNQNNLTLYQINDTSGTNYTGKVVDKAENETTCQTTIRKDSQGPYVSKTELAIHGDCYHTDAENRVYECMKTASDSDRRFYVSYTIGPVGVNHIERWNCDTNEFETNATTTDNTIINRFVSRPFTAQINEKIKYVVYDNLGRSDSSECKHVYINNSFWQYRITASIGEPGSYEGYLQSGSAIYYNCGVDRKLNYQGKTEYTSVDDTRKITGYYQKYQEKVQKVTEESTSGTRAFQLTQARYKNISVDCSYKDSVGNLHTASAKSDKHWYCYETTLENVDGKGNSGKATNCIVKNNCHYCSGPCYNQWASQEDPPWKSGTPNDDTRKEHNCAQSFFSQ